MVFLNNPSDEQLLIVGPIARWVLTTFIQNHNQADITFGKS
ncbi:hypothetical protein ACQKE5_02805 [Paenisporosarcina sp. NPDC076898]